MDQNELHKALEIVRQDAFHSERENTVRLDGKPLNGWSPEKHAAYYEKAINQALAVQAYCFTRMMQINPD